MRLVSAVYALPLFLLTPYVAAQEFPLTMSHVYGETTIPAKPQRVVTWGWASGDAAVALGVIPVGVPEFTYGAEDDGSLIWTNEAIAEQGGEKPTLLSRAGGVPYEAIAALDPDVIIAVYSGVTEDEYTRLSQIAPVVAYPETPWSTPWQQTITLTGTILGQQSEAEALVADLEQFLTDETAKYPQVAGKTFAGIVDYDGAIQVYSRRDPRMTFLEDAGLVLAPSVEILDAGDTFFFSLSYERLAELESDILISYIDTPELDAEFYARPTVANVDQVKSGAVAHVIGQKLINSVSPPSALSLKWGYPEFIKAIADAAANADASK